MLRLNSCFVVLDMTGHPRSWRRPKQRQQQHPITHSRRERDPQLPRTLLWSSPWTGSTQMEQGILWDRAHLSSTGGRTRCNPMRLLPLEGCLGSPKVGTLWGGLLIHTEVIGRTTISHILPLRPALVFDMVLGYIFFKESLAYLFFMLFFQERLIGATITQPMFRVQMSNPTYRT